MIIITLHYFVKLIINIYIYMNVVVTIILWSWLYMYIYVISILCYYIYIICYSQSCKIVIVTLQNENKAKKPKLKWFSFRKCQSLGSRRFFWLQVQCSCQYSFPLLINLFKCPAIHSGNIYVLPAVHHALCEMSEIQGNKIPSLSPRARDMWKEAETAHSEGTHKSGAGEMGDGSVGRTCM